MSGNAFGYRNQSEFLIRNAEDYRLDIVPKRTIDIRNPRQGRDIHEIQKKNFNLKMCIGTSCKSAFRSYLSDLSSS